MGGPDGFFSKLLRIGLGVSLELLQKGECVDGAHLAEQGDGAVADACVFIDELRGRDGLGERADDFLVLLDFLSLYEVRQIIDVLLLPELRHGVAPHLWIGIAESEEVEAGLDDLAQFGIGVGGREVSGGEEQRLAGGILEHFAIGDADAFGESVGVG